MARSAGQANSTAAPTNSLVQWALIGLLIERSSYGYELAQRFERTYGGLLRLSGVSYVYTALDALKRRELIEEVEVSEDDRRMPRVHYRVTSKGVRAYQERLLAQMRENDRRSRLLARQLALLVPEPGLALGVLDRYERECLEEAEGRPLRAGASSPSGSEGRAQTAERLAAEEASPLTRFAARVGGVRAARAQGALAGGWPPAVSCSSSIASRPRIRPWGQPPCRAAGCLATGGRRRARLDLGPQTIGALTLLRIAAGLEATGRWEVRFAGRKLTGATATRCVGRSATAGARSGPATAARCSTS